MMIRKRSEIHSKHVIDGIFFVKQKFLFFNRTLRSLDGRSIKLCATLRMFAWVMTNDEGPILMVVNSVDALAPDLKL